MLNCGGQCLLGCTEAARSGNWWWSFMALANRDCSHQGAKRDLLHNLPWQTAAMYRSGTWQDEMGLNKLLLYLEKLFCISTHLPNPLFSASKAQIILTNPRWSVAGRREASGSGGLGISMVFHKTVISSKAVTWETKRECLNAVAQWLSWHNCWLCYAWFKPSASIARPNKQSLISPQNTVV